MQTPLEKVAAPGYPHREDLAVHAATLQLPLSGALRGGGGVVFVMKTPRDLWLGWQQEGRSQKADFFVGLGQVGLRHVQLAYSRRHVSGRSHPLHFCIHC